MNRRLREAPASTTDDVLVEAVRDAVLALVTVLKALGAARKDLDRSVVAHLGDSRAAYDGPDAIAALAGMTPVTTQSGKHRAVHFRWACNKRFRKTITIFADNSRHASPWAEHILSLIHI